MVFNDTTNLAGLIQDCEQRTGIGNTGISGVTNTLKYFTALINNWYDKVITMILSAQDDWDFDDTNATDFPIATTPMVASQRDYSLSNLTGILTIKRIDATYDGTNWYRCNPVDSNEMSEGLGNDTLTDARFSKTKPYYDASGTSIMVYPMASATDVSAGAKIRVEFSRRETLFVSTDTTKVPGFDPMFHPMLSIGASFDFCSSNQLPQKNDLWTMLQDYEMRLKQYYAKKDSDRSWVLKGAYVRYD